MTVTMQILSGGLILALCSLVHLCILTGAVRLLRLLGEDSGKPYGLRIVKLMGTGLAAAVSAHIIQVWMWAAMFVVTETLPDFSEAVYFSLATYTTLGYGDVVVGKGVRIFAAMAAVTGLLNFGLSTAFLVGIYSRLMRDGR
ncbi:MAG: potassium channel family protein [Deltaproteobacteria bacterium]|nr:potassium channel family protein [Deltaproteobacteria bacterium]